MFVPGTSKKDFVGSILADLDFAGNFSEPVPEKVYHLIWWNPINPNSYRLTLFIYRILSKKYPAYTYKFDNIITNRTLLDLEKTFKFPYFIHGRKEISIFTDNDAVMIELLGGDISVYLENLARQQ